MNDGVNVFVDAFGCGDAGFQDIANKVITRFRFGPVDLAGERRADRAELGAV